MSEQEHALPSLEMLKRALDFYECSPDGQYDLDVVCPVLEYLIARAASPHQGEPE